MDRLERGGEMDDTRPVGQTTPGAEDVPPAGERCGGAHGGGGAAPAPRGAVSRRGFIKGVIASGATAYGASFLFRQSGSAGAQPAVAGAAERLVTLEVNGMERRVDVLPNEQLAMTLRYKLGLTGTKLGCDRAECGACTVLLDGVPHYACSVLTHQVRGRAVTTIEGLERPDGTLHPVQQAVWDEAGFQCAFCAPGSILAMVATLEENPDVTREEMRQALSGNLCR
jgi:aerobic-type carbon monoxide dehydrogenase small subunit (CoxS/CutS family)